jgi:hypothetical protein
MIWRTITSGRTLRIDMVIRSKSRCPPRGDRLIYSRKTHQRKPTDDGRDQQADDQSKPMPET